MPEPTTVVVRSQGNIPVDDGRSTLNPEAREFMVSKGDNVSDPLPQRPAKPRNREIELASEITTGVYSTDDRGKCTGRNDLQMTPLLRFSLKLDGKRTTAIMDSGSQYCIIEENELREIPNPEITNRKMLLRGIGDPSLVTESRKTATLGVTIDGIDYGRFDFLVVNHLKEKVILGMPFS